MLKPCPTFATPWTVALQASLWDFSNKNAGVGCHFLLQIFPTQGLNLHLLQLLGHLGSLWFNINQLNINPLHLINDIIQDAPIFSFSAHDKIFSEKILICLTMVFFSLIFLLIFALLSLLLRCLMVYDDVFFATCIFYH